MFAESSSSLCIAEVHNCRILTPTRSWASNPGTAEAAYRRTGSQQGPCGPGCGMKPSAHGVGGGREVGLEDRSLENVDTCRRQEGWPRKKGPRGRQVTGVRCSRGKTERVLREKEDGQQNGKDSWRSSCEIWPSKGCWRPSRQRFWCSANVEAEE